MAETQLDGETTEEETNGHRPDSDIEVLAAIDEHLEADDREYPISRERPTPDDEYAVEDRLGGDTRAQATVGIDYVREDGIAVDGDSYIGFTKVEPRNWLALDESERTDVLAAYTSFLLSLQSPVTIPCYPEEFDLSAHLQQFQAAGQDRPNDESDVLQHGRRYYIDWADRRVDSHNIKQRSFYLVTRVDASHVHADLDSGRAVGRLPLIGRLVDGVRSVVPGLGSEDEQAREELCVREVRKRQKTVASNLGRTGVGLDIVRDRDDAMALLYHYYNHVDPTFDRFDQATRTTADGHSSRAPSSGGGDA